jgi:hypothetical protein
MNEPIKQFEEIKVYDNAAIKPIFNRLQDLVFSKKGIIDRPFPWFFIETTGKERQEDFIDQYSFYHIVYGEGQIYSNVYDVCYDMIITMLDKYETEEVEYIDRIRLALITNKGKSIQHDYHVDADIEHRVGLLYLNDSDGDTRFSSSLYDTKSGVPTGLFPHSDDCVFSCDPKENRLVLFDGRRYHGSTSPVNYMDRLTLNFNYVVKKK